MSQDADATSSRRAAAPGARFVSAHQRANVVRSHGQRRIAGRYAIERKLGEGGMATVYRATDVSTNRTLALKQLHADASAKVAMLFEREFHTLATLRHPNIVEVYDYGTDAGVPYYTMELLDGADLQDAAPSPWAEVCRWLRIAATTLTTLHARRLLHRDLSPRNLWRTPLGDIKLIDFGALAPFGVTGDIVGTPPFVPPEAFNGAELDARSDLYALGALAYWLLTGAHAYPARSLRDLPERWELPVSAPSQRLQALKRPELPEIPQEFDALVLSLLSHDPRARPMSAPELIDRLDAIPGIQHEERSGPPVTHFSSTQLVGRTGALELVLGRLGQERGGAFCFKGPRGMGRSRLLRELGLHARLRGAAVVHVEAELQKGNYGVARELALRLFQVLPEQAATCAGADARTIAQLSPDVRDAMGLEAADLPSSPATMAEARVNMQNAFRRWMTELGRVQRLVITVDDLQAADDASAAVLLELSRIAPQNGMLIVTSFRTEPAGSTHADKNEVAPAASALQQASRRMALSPLSKPEVLELIGSAFGQAPNVPRLASQLHVRSRGNPRECLQIAEHLVTSNVIAYADGTWVVPPDIADSDLPASPEDVIQARLALLAEDARQLAQVMSIRAHPTTIEVWTAVTGIPTPRLFELLDVLVKANVLGSAGTGYYFRNGVEREIVARDLDAVRAREAHRALGNALLARPNLSTLDELEAAVHLLQAADIKRGAPIACRAGLHITLHEIDHLSAAVPALETAARILSSAGLPDRQMMSVLVPLAVAGFFTHHRFGTAYGEAAISACARTLHLHFMTRMRPLFGLCWSLFMGLTRAYLGLAYRAGTGVPTLKQAITLCVLCVGALSGMATLCVDSDKVSRYAKTLEPLSGFGADHMIRFVYDYCCNLAITVSDKPARAYARWLELLERLQDPVRTRGFPRKYHTVYLAGALHACGALECYRDDAMALRTAEKLDALQTPFASISAEKIRMMYYAIQGNALLSEHHRRCLEDHAIQQGTAWQVEVSAPAGAILVYLRTHDALSMKRDTKQLQRLAREIVSLRIYEERARGTYLLLRGQAAQALPHLRSGEMPLVQGEVGSAQALLTDVDVRFVGARPTEAGTLPGLRGALVRAYNAIGRHEDARRTCQSMLDKLTDEDRKFPAVTLLVHTELAIAEAALGEHEAAIERINALLALHLPNQSAVTLGQIYEARLQVAERTGDHAAAAESLAEVERWYRSTTSASLIARCEHWRRRLSRALGGRHMSDSGEQCFTPDGVSGSAELCTLPPSEALRQLLTSSGAHEGFVLYAEQTSPRDARHADRSVQESIVHWAEEKLESALDQSGATETLDGDDGGGSEDVLTVGTRHYRFHLLQHPDNDVEIVGAVVAGQKDGSPWRAKRSNLRALARAILTA